MKPKPWTLLESEYLIQDDWLKLRGDACRLPDGRIIRPYYVLEYPDWVHVVAITPAQELVLIQQYRHGTQEIILEIPGGVMDEADESPLAAAKRELREETGYGSETFQFLGDVNPNPASQTNTSHFFLATNARLEAAQSLDENEDIEVVLTPLSEVLDLMRKGVFRQTLNVSALFFALDRLGYVHA